MSGRQVALRGLDAAQYQPHALHGPEQVWVEKNCYVDIWVELLHALQLEPRACLAFALPVDFEGDHWTFIKPPHGDLHRLYGIDVQELNVWRPLIEHAAEYLAAGKLVSTEADAFWLPDTAGTDYRSAHTKTTIVLNDLDVAAERLGYFHNAGYHALEGEDFRQLFRIDPPSEAGVLPLYAELIRVDRVQRRAPPELAAIALPLLREQFERRPADNPMRRFGERLAADWPALLTHGLPHYHAWAFSTIRQFGAAFELAGTHLRWISAHGGPDCADAAVAFERIAQGGKAMILKLARAVNTRKPLDAATLVDELAGDWSAGMAALGRALAA